MVGRVLICGEPIFGRGVAGVSGVGAGKYSPDPPCHADNRRLPTVCHKQTLPSLPWFRISTQIINYSYVVNYWKLQKNLNSCTNYFCLRPSLGLCAEIK